MSLAKQNFASVSEEAINVQINAELEAAQAYLSLAAWAGNVNVALPGLTKFFQESATEERDHANKLINYQNLRGGKVVLTDLKVPEANWTSAKVALETALQLEKDVNKSLLNLHKIAEEQNDPQLCDYLESEFLGEQVVAIKKLADFVTQLNRVGGDGLGLYLFDQDLLAGKSINIDHAI
ncbi:764_t:CDS:1 [Ambispora leptoticha]|uniref:Ferritin n=1 Tax=Ambispora leptoticha TaxID=144679 RepID=A0A9N9A4T3_9GLOM|nr:764_t:CDS:1 [Ambispora leptoticha]